MNREVSLPIDQLITPPQLIEQLVTDEQLVGGIDGNPLTLPRGNLRASGCPLEIHWRNPLA